MNKKDSTRINKVIKSALEEDIKSGDITTLAIVKKKQKATAEFLVKENGIIAGLSVAKKVFKHVDQKLKLKTFFKDGSSVKTGDIIAVVEGKASSILTAERTALNLLQRMSGIATATFLYQDKIKHTKAKIIDTRKTAPGLRLIDKMAVKIGGAENHRIGLYDMFLIKDNHIEVAGSITDAVNSCKKYLKRLKTKPKIEVETKNLAEVEEALNCSVDVIMLDNFKLEEMKKAVELINGKCKVEASGGINLSTVTQVAETGVDYISVGALTHSVKSLDISLEIKAK